MILCELGELHRKVDIITKKVSEDDEEIEQEVLDLPVTNFCSTVEDFHTFDKRIKSSNSFFTAVVSVIMFLLINLGLR